MKKAEKISNNMSKESIIESTRAKISEANRLIKLVKQEKLTKEDKESMLNFHKEMEGSKEERGMTIKLAIFLLSIEPEDEVARLILEKEK